MKLVVAGLIFAAVLGSVLLFAIAQTEGRKKIMKRIWVGAVREGLWVMENGQLSQVPEAQLPMGEARSLLADSSGRLWLEWNLKLPPNTPARCRGAAAATGCKICAGGCRTSEVFLH